MQAVDALSLVGEVLSWFGLGIGIPALLFAAVVGALDGRWDEIEIAVVDRDGYSLARWFAQGDFHERPLRRSESPYAEPGWHAGFVSSNDPQRARLGEPPHLRRVLVTLGIVFCSVGVLGLIASLMPLLF
ncbi:MULTISPECIES: hypothetical protein [unclassified Microbacterium]|uniref:hypothetical protein n=1 Tax=unclassified Microbacterium TaxID=2609290 RepID=UPI000EA94A21|nr:MULTISPECIES: hypothetical protein [unclassified Microbacterium]MBT2484073.1 hypothetical protein [Microbacterium sp. ISL-108]RKN67024.1 hypothetical protein D7252_05115 [Microbacterium sp. CGR2]